MNKFYYCEFIDSDGERHRSIARDLFTATCILQEKSKLAPIKSVYTDYATPYFCISEALGWEWTKEYTLEQALDEIQYIVLGEEVQKVFADYIKQWFAEHQPSLSRR